ncbi:hypothetical protein MNAN1_000322a [Malassezia nana]|uniref:Pheromone n=1 Tax=Malassezia nana TaxID=180528 RepID=A0AAF0EIS5_9BASI|nr:hypothetical protein MNAN1_000322a [Malassezia nana]
MNTLEQNQTEIKSMGTHLKDKDEVKDTKPVNYEWPPTPEPNPTYLCVIA